MENSLADLFQRFGVGGGRECNIWDGTSAKVDAIGVCHEVRCLSLLPAEKTTASFRILGRNGFEEFCKSGEVCELKGLQLDEVLLLSIWASADDPDTVPRNELRACGEARIPVRHLVTRFDRMLYRTWISLEAPGLSDSVASMGHSSASVKASAGDEFDQALSDAARQLFQPKACITVCRAEDLGPGRQPLWTFDTPNKERVARWGALLRSQKQHVVLATAQHLHHSQQQKESHFGQLEQQIEDFEAQAKAQTKEQEFLRERLRSCQDAQKRELDASRDYRRRVNLRELEEKGARQLEESFELAISSAERAARRGRNAEAVMELEKQRSQAEQLQQEIDGLEEELASIRQEAKDKMEAAEGNIRSLVQKREDAERLASDKRAENQRLQREVEELTKENSTLAEQKEMLMHIVEDLHQTCAGNGLTASVDAINSIANYKFP